MQFTTVLIIFVLHSISGKFRELLFLPSVFMERNRPREIEAVGLGSNLIFRPGGPHHCHMETCVCVHAQLGIISRISDTHCLHRALEGVSFAK